MVNTYSLLGYVHDISGVCCVGIALVVGVGNWAACVFILAIVKWATYALHGVRVCACTGQNCVLSENQMGLVLDWSWYASKPNRCG